VQCSAVTLLGIGNQIDKDVNGLAKGLQCRADQCSAVQCSAVQCSAVLCSAVRCGAVQCTKWILHGEDGCAVHRLVGEGLVDRCGEGGNGRDPSELLPEHVADGEDVKIMLRKNLSFSGSSDPRGKRRLLRQLQRNMMAIPVRRETPTAMATMAATMPASRPGPRAPRGGGQPLGGDQQLENTILIV
jgi:hypothetical protein